MVKSIIKEIIITILLCIAILLVLSVLFYDYNPLTKTVPSKIAYTTPENIKEEVEEEITELEKTNIVYTIDGSDLNIYKKSNKYVAGKADPFASSASNGNTNTSNVVNTNTPSNNTSNNQQVNTVVNTNTNPDSQGTYFNNTGLK
ncbi:MAG: hypothetical protein ACLTEH_02835 [Clostridia bacterium]